MPQSDINEEATKTYEQISFQHTAHICTCGICSYCECIRVKQDHHRNDGTSSQASGVIQLYLLVLVCQQCQQISATHVCHLSVYQYCEGSQS